MLSDSATLTIASPRPTTRTASPLSNATSPQFSPMHGHSHDSSVHHYSQPRNSSSDSSSRPSMSSSSTSSPTPDGNGMIRVSQSDSDESRDLVHPLGPRWGDYSFRESDLIYSAPPPQGQPVREWGRRGRDSPSPVPGSPAPGMTIRKVSSDILSKLKRRDEQPAEKGFQVSRPPRTVPVAEGERSTSGSSGISGGSSSGTSGSSGDSGSDDQK